MAEVRQLSSEGLETGRPLTRKRRVAWLWICLQCLQVGAGGYEASCFPLAVCAHTPQPALPLTDSPRPPLLPGPVFPHGFPLFLQTAPAILHSRAHFDTECPHHTPLVPGHHLCRTPHLHPCWEFQVNQGEVRTNI